MHTDLFINGHYVQPRTGDRFDDVEPGTGRLLASVASADEDDVADAVAAARAAADDGPWPRLSADQRARILNRFADGIERRARELSVLEARDVGKPVTECKEH